MHAEVGPDVDWDRVHFLGQVPYADYQKIIQISRCHVYLTMPFVLSWSLLETMSMGAVVVASDVAPVREAITDGETGLLVDVFDPKALAARVVEVLSRPKDFEHLGAAARDHVVEKYDFLTKCLPGRSDQTKGGTNQPKNGTCLCDRALRCQHQITGLNVEIPRREQPIRRGQIKGKHNAGFARATGACADCRCLIFSQDQDAFGVGARVIHASDDR